MSFSWHHQRIYWMGREYVFVRAWDATEYEDESGLQPLPYHTAESRVRWWMGEPELARRLREVVRRFPNEPPRSDGWIVDEFRFGSWKLFELPRVERKPVKIAEGAGAPAPGYVPPPAPPPTEEAPPKTWFEVKVVDEFGKPIDGLEVVFSQGSRQETLETNGAGIVRWKDIEGPSTAWVKVANLATLREKLKPRYAKGGERKTPDGPDVTKVMLGIDDPGKPLSSELPGILVIAKPLTRVRLIGMHFDTNKCFLREPAMHGIRKVVSVYKANPTGKLLIVGHTDTTGDDAYNLDLSVERAEAVKAYLKDDVAAWEAWFGDGKPEKKRWGIREINEMIKALPCEKSVANFQQWSNDNRGTDLKVDGIAGPKTRKALIEAYMALDGTTLPKSIEAVVHGCGEFFPRKNEEDQYGKDGVEADENRRVEMFCFDDDIQPPVPATKAKKDEPEYEQWKKHVTSTVDLGASPSQVICIRLVDRNGEPRAGEPYKLRGPGIFISDKTDSDGVLVHDIPLTAKTVVLEYADYRWELTVSEMRPANEEPGATDRLQNLRLDLEEDATRMKQALQRMQAKFEMAITGELDAATA